MAARDAQFYNYLKEALKNKLRYPEASSFRSGKYFFDYEYIFQQARRVLPQKYSIGHSYWKHDNQSIPISYLNKQQLNELNLEFARDVVESWGGLEEKPTDKRYLDPVLVEYEHELTAPEEPDSFHEENERNLLPSSESGPESTESPPGPSTETPSLPGHSAPHQQPIQRYIIPQRAVPAKQKTEEQKQELKQKMEQAEQAPLPEEKINALPERRTPQISSKSRKTANRPSSPPSEPPLPPPRIPPPPIPGTANTPFQHTGSSSNMPNRKNRRRAPFLPKGAGSGFGFPPWIPRVFSQLARGALNALSNLGRMAFNAAARGLAQVLPRLGAQAALQAGRGLLMGAGGVGAALVTTGALAIWGIVIAITAIALGILWLYNDMIANSECNKPAGEMRVEKRITNSLDSNDPSIRNEDPEIRYLIEMSYELLCKNRRLETVTVTDKIPAGTRYDPDRPSAKSGFRNDDSTGPEGVYDPTTNTLTWTFTNFPTLSPVYIYFNVLRETTDSWIVNEATVAYRTSGAGSAGGFSDVTGLLPTPLPPPPADWENIKSSIIAAINKYPELFDVYKEASAQSGIPWQVLAGLHFVETGSNPRPGFSLVSGRAIGGVEPDISPSLCDKGVRGPGIPIPVGGGCGFASQTESAIYAANHLAGKINKIPSTFPEIVQAMSMYNGGGNANCGEGLPYGPCPPQFKGEDDPYPMADFDEAHSSKKMYLIYCGDRLKCNARLFDRPGGMGVVRALIEGGI